MVLLTLNSGMVTKKQLILSLPLKSGFGGWYSTLFLFDTESYSPFNTKRAFTVVFC